MANAPVSRGSTVATASSWRSAALDFARDEVADDFGVGLALELAAFGDELIAERLEILDDAVVDQRDAADDVRVRVADRRRAMRRPARVRDSGASMQRLRRELSREIVELALRPAADELASIDRADAGQVIAAIFEPLEPIEQPLRDVALPDNPDNSAHKLTRQPSSSSARGSGGPNRRCLSARCARLQGCRRSTSRVMTEPAPTIAPSPTLTGATSAVFEPMKAPAPISVRYLPNPS